MATATARAVQPLHFDQAPLPFAEDALAPIISAETIQFHYGKHHKKYYDTLNQLLQKEPVANARTLEDVVRNSSGKLFNNAGQAWNHNFYWQSLSASDSQPSQAMRKRLEKDFGSYDAFCDKLATAANGQFGSGWAWLVRKDGKLDVVSTGNADTPMARGIQCLLTIDVWEHAYYIDYRNQREKYVQALIEKRLNWEFAEQNLNSGSGR
ncbi:MAG TPA: superoxide dismutase [Burkholderiales bacterium]|nr:superoxide dismutase [Burkholderiales bacterium]